jgi:hypothetical protein
VLADYNRHHPKVLPPSLFSDLLVEKGGIGAGTIFHVTLRILGQTQRLHMRVDEPDPGRVLCETNLVNGAVTFFTVFPLEDPTQTVTHITSDWGMPNTLSGQLDRLFTPYLLRYIYTQELRQLERYLKTMPLPLE